MNSCVGKSLGLIGATAGLAFLLLRVLKKPKSIPKLSILTNYELVDYMDRMGPAHSAGQKELWNTIQKHPKVMMSSPPHSVNYLAWLVQSMGFKKCIEVGVFCGYTTLALARAVPEGGKVVGLDLTDEYPAIAEKYWTQDGVRKKIDLRIGKAVESLDKMLSEDGEGSYDFAFIDANKSDYHDYYEKCLKLVRVGGIVAIDNVFWHGKILKSEKEFDDDTKAIATLNKKIQSDDRINQVMIPIADGLTLCTKLR